MAWNIDTSHSEILFTVRHMMISNVRGQFNKFSGTINLDEATPTNSSVDVSIDVASINTRDEKRDGHLTSPDFFDAATYPTITFKSTKVEKTGDTTGKIHGDLTIKGVTKAVTLDATFMGKAKSPWGTTSAGFNASTKINRTDFGLTWNVALETGGILVGEEISINIELEAVES
ncbi:MAG: YceI family protein [Roseiflexaceae bacterium]|jgi:polyisoprenoid-binding protein YceI